MLLRHLDGALDRHAGVLASVEAFRADGLVELEPDYFTCQLDSARKLGGRERRNRRLLAGIGRVDGPPCQRRPLTSAGWRCCRSGCCRCRRLSRRHAHAESFGEHCRSTTVDAYSEIVSVRCPGPILPRAKIERSSQNLPRRWRRSHSTHQRPACTDAISPALR